VRTGAPSRTLLRGRLAALAIPAGAMAAATLLAATGKGGVAAFYLGPFSSTYALGNMLESASVLAVAAAGAFIALRAGAVNLGGEGQFFLGALAGHALLISSGGMSPVIAIPLAAAAALLSAAALGGLSSGLRRLSGADELITSFLASQAAIPVLDWAVAGPLKDPGSQLIATRALPSALGLARLMPPSALNAGIFGAGAAAAAAWILLRRTRTGYLIRMEGLSPDFSAASGLPGSRVRAFAMIAGAGLMGLAGLWAAQGRSLRVFQSFAAGRGFSALACALVAGTRPALVPVSAFFFSFLEAGSRSAQAAAGVPAQSAAIIQALVLLAVAAGAGRERKR